MPAKQPIKIKSQGDNICIMLDATIDFDTITNMLRKKIADAREFFEGVSSSVAFKGRVLTDSEKQHLLDIIEAETTMRVTLADTDDTIKTPPQPVMATPQTPHKSPSNTNYTNSDTAYYQGGLRSGQSIKYAGSVVILGDVNPGSEVVADGNVIILGNLKGMAHAGASGNTSCFVSALTLQPTQLRIAHLITHVPPPPIRGKKEPPKPSIAYVKDEQVFIGPL